MVYTFEMLVDRCLSVATANEQRLWWSGVLGTFTCLFLAAGR
jgi:hypothetical protein